MPGMAKGFMDKLKRTTKLGDTSGATLSKEQIDSASQQVKKKAKGMMGLGISLHQEPQVYEPEVY